MPEPLRMAAAAPGGDIDYRHWTVRALRLIFMYLFLWATAVARTAAADPGRGEQLYLARCGACHSIDANGPGPLHRGLFGREAGSVPDYDYSAPLRQSGIVWTQDLLSRWIANPNAVVPGNKMVVQLANDPVDRADIIEYLSVATTTREQPRSSDHAGSCVAIDPARCAKD